jgi:hypothetical protein
MILKCDFKVSQTLISYGTLRNASNFKLFKYIQCHHSEIGNFMHKSRKANLKSPLPTT